jgi:hypothetical protein
MIAEYLLESKMHTRKNKNNVKRDRGRSERNYTHPILRTLCNFPAPSRQCAPKPCEWKPKTPILTSCPFFSA